jgi:hypothetical protein
MFSAILQAASRYSTVKSSRSAERIFERNRPLPHHSSSSGATGSNRHQMWLSLGMVSIPNSIFEFNSMNHSHFRRKPSSRSNEWIDSGATERFVCATWKELPAATTG